MPKPNLDRPPTPETCPVCGEDVPRNALACPECGADHRSGWREGAVGLDGVDLPDDDDFDYDEFRRREFGSSVKPVGLKTIWWVSAIVVLAALVYLYIRGLF